MDAALKTSIWLQYGAALDTLEDAIKLCPDALWTMSLWDDSDDPRYGQFWFVVYHTLFWSDLFMHGAMPTFTPPAPFQRRGLPETLYTKEQLYTYLGQVRTKAKSIIQGLTDETAYAISHYEWIQAPYLEMQFYAMRHIQEHAAQLNLVLGQKGVTGQDWVPQARETGS